MLVCKHPVVRLHTINQARTTIEFQLSILSVQYGVYPTVGYWTVDIKICDWVLDN